MYKKLIFKRIVFSIFSIIFLFVFTMLSLKTGAVNISLKNLLTGNLDERMKFIVLNLRLTRTLAAIIAGAAIGLAGAVLQNILRNPLASPFTLGITQGSAFGAAFGIIVLNTIFHFKYLIILSAFTGSIIAVIFVILVSYFADESRESVILAGVAIGAFFNAAIMFIKYFATDVQVASAVFWTFGDLSKADYSSITIMFIFTIIALIIFILNSWNYNAITWGDETAKSFGINLKQLNIVTILLASLLSSITTSFLGIIGFIGLIAPHIVRMAIGNDYRFLIPLSAINGGLFLLLADIISRTVLKPAILPVGIITSFGGIPLFIYILIKLKRNHA